MNNLQKLVRMSKYAGERFDLIQAGGGNSSVKKENGTMWIKASGYLLSDVSETHGLSLVDTQKVAKIVEDPTIVSCAEKKAREHLTAQKMKEATLSKEIRPSIETLLHALLAQFTLHTHPIIVNAATLRKDWKENLQELFPDALFVRYQTPGIELAIELKKEMKEYLKRQPNPPKVIFLQNHGLIVSSDCYEEIEPMTENILLRLEEMFLFDFSCYRQTTQLSKLIQQIEPFSPIISYLSEDLVLQKLLKIHKKLFFSMPFCPDKLVFCGAKAVEIEDVANAQPFIDYLKNFGELPKVVLWKNALFFLAESVKKAKEAEEVFKFHLLALNASNTSAVEYLEEDEIAYLSNWEAEKFRQKI